MFKWLVFLTVLPLVPLVVFSVAGQWGASAGWWCAGVVYVGAPVGLGVVAWWRLGRLGCPRG